MAEKEAKDLGFSFSNLTEAVNKFRNPITSLSKEVSDSVGTFNKLSSTGNSFNNDVIGMKVAAANTRMTLDELTQVVGENGKSFSGLGGSVAKGSQVFTDFSKTFFDSGVAENLRQMGFTSKDLNEVLALQIGAQKSTTDTSVQGQVRTAAAAASLAEEMDLIAKLTGKSRKEQEEQMAKAQQDGQIEAKMRLIGLQQGAEAEKAARENFAKQLAQAQAMGTDQVFKEMFATGTVRSREASMQMGLLGDAARETANSAKALAKGNVEASQSAMDAAKVGNMANQKNEAMLQIAAAGVGDAGAAMKKNVETNDAAYHGMVKTQKAAEAMGVQLNNTSEALKLQREAIREEQKARHGITSLIVAANARSQDLTAAVANQVVKPLNEGKIAEQAGKFAESISQGVKANESAATSSEKYLRSLARQPGLGGRDQAPASAREKIEAAIPTSLVKGFDKIVGGGLEGIGNAVPQIGQMITDVMEVKKFNATLPSRDDGTLGKTGQPFEPQDILAHIHKGEMVLTPEQAKNFIAGAKTDGITSVVTDLAKSMPKIDMSKVPGNIDISSKMEEMKKGFDVKSIPAAVTKTAEIKKSIPAAVTKTAEIKSDASKGFKMPSMDQISFGLDGLPRISAQPQARAMASQVAAEKAPVKAAPSAENEAAKQGIMAKQPQTSTSAPAASGKSSTLDDVVKELNYLNNTMAQLAKITGETNNLVERQIKATKSMSGNLFGAQ